MQNIKTETPEVKLRAELTALENRHAELSAQLGTATGELEAARAGLVDGTAQLETVTAHQATATALNEALNTLASRIEAKRGEIEQLLETEAAAQRRAELRAIIDEGLEAQTESAAIFAAACLTVEEACKRLAPPDSARWRAHEALVRAQREPALLDSIPRAERDALGFDGTPNGNHVLIAPGFSHFATYYVFHAFASYRAHEAKTGA